ncbi:hypothetical protein WJX81_002098 [Elliptochloris bilobata]|uniref:Uncharacterized protein n=1 Tax=Elliptochloris bilobata TaxID=381761 RepID=A0AAW1RU35_9CHLO
MQTHFRRGHRVVSAAEKENSKASGTSARKEGSKEDLAALNAVPLHDVDTAAHKAERLQLKALRHEYIQRTVLQRLTSSPGVSGTLAIIGGFFLKLDPFGGLHWDSSHAVIGLACAAPLIFTDMTLMLPTFSHVRESEAHMIEGRTVGGNIETSQREAHAATRQAEGAAGGAAQPSGAVEDPKSEGFLSAWSLVSAAGEACLRGAPHMSKLTVTSAGRAALERVQLQLMGMGASLLPLPADLALIAASRLGSEMFSSAICLVGSAHWIRDRLYEAGLVNAVLPSALDALYSAVRGPEGVAAPPMTGAGLWLATYMWASTLAGAGIYSIVNTKGVKFGPGSTAADQQIVAQLNSSSFGAELVRMEQTAMAIITARDVMRLLSLCGSFIATGNLLAPIVGSIAAGGLRSGWKRLKVAHRRAERHRVRKRVAMHRASSDPAATEAAARAEVPLEDWEQHGMSPDHDELDDDF